MTHFPHLSPREREVCKLVAEGKSNKEIADALGIADGTLKQYLSALYGKVELQNWGHSRVRLALYWQERVRVEAELANKRVVYDADIFDGAA